MQIEVQLEIERSFSDFIVVRFRLYSSYIRFENQYSSNQWCEGFFHIQPTTADFQIVFEATVSAAQISDIAIDDVSLLQGADCTVGTSSQAVTQEADGIYDLQSCKNRCNEMASVIFNEAEKFIHDENFNLIERCDCHYDCENLDTCCPDYQLQCNNSMLELWRFSPSFQFFQL